MIRTLVFLFAASGLSAQYVSIPDTEYPADSRPQLNLKPASRVGAGAPSGACTAGLDFYVRTSDTSLYICPAGTWVQLSTGGGGTWGSITGTLSAQTDLQAALDAKQALDADLTAFAALSTNGIVARTGTATYVPRTVAGTANQITVTNGDGVSGAPVISIPTSPTLPGTTTGTFSGNLTGNVTGNVSGSAGSATGNAATATALAANGTNCSAGSYPLGVDASGNVESCTVAGGGGGSGTVTSVDATGGVQTASGSAITSSGTIRGALITNAQTGTTYTVLTGDRGKVLTFSNAGAIAVTLPQAGTGFEDGWFAIAKNIGAGDVTITPTTSTISGAATAVVSLGEFILITSNGTNYEAEGVRLAVDSALSLTRSRTSQTIGAGATLVTLTGPQTLVDKTLTGPIMTAPVLGTPASGVATNLTGTAASLTAGLATALAANPSDCAANNFATTIAANGDLTCAQPSISAGVSGLGTGVATALGTPSSANLAAALTDETGSGAAVFATSPTLITPALGTPSAVVLTNATGTAASLTAGAATALAANPINCSGSLPRGIEASGNAEGCADVDLTTEVTGVLPDGNIASGITRTIASGTKALDTDAIASGACDTLATTTATGTASTDVVSFTANADITAVTGYAPVTTGGLAIYVWPTTNTINYKVCNPTASSITPGAVTLNYRVTR